LSQVHITATLWSNTSEVSLDNIFFTEGYCASDPQDAQGNEIHRSQIQ
jgi:hypothetical protein